MALETQQLSSLSNPLVTPEQLITTSTQLDQIPADLEQSLRFAAAQLTQAAGILLRLPQEIIARAIVILYRFYVGAEGGSFRTNAAKDVSAASLYLVAKPSFHPQPTRTLLNVYTYLTSPASPLNSSTNQPQHEKPDPGSYYLSESAYIDARSTLLQTETIILRSIAFTTHVVTPHHLALTYLQTLDVLPSPPSALSKRLAKRTIALLNTALLSPQILYLTHHPPALAVAAIYLAAREVGETLSREEWWEVFDVEREELGFLVVGMNSVEGWVWKERDNWKERGRGCPLDAEGLEREISLRKQEEDGIE
ncbi:MAG: hypothetical protein Q9164_004114 [Protoblastenia rupestris]